jgi:protein gp37
LQTLQWVIVGGESGANARPMELDWVRDLARQCEAHQVPLFVKQLGTVWSAASGLGRSHGGEWDLWPADLRVRQMPQGVDDPALAAS